jgi:hypothetical protein
MSTLDLWQLMANVVTVFGLPLAIYTYVSGQRKERDNEDEEVYQILSDAYIDFMKLALEHCDLKLRTRSATVDLNEDQREKMQILFEILISLFERAYLTAYSEDMTAPQRRRWHSWDDFMREWCRREDFHNALPVLLQGEDKDFASYIHRIDVEERRRSVEDDEPTKSLAPQRA